MTAEGYTYAHWKLNESSGTNVPDTSGNSRNGTCVNMEDGDWVAGKLNNCLQFGGVDEYVNCQDIANFERTDIFSIECWFKTSVDGKQIITRTDHQAPYKGWAIYMSTGKIAARLTSSSTNRIVILGDTGSLNNNVYHHLIVTYDGSSTAAGLKIYVDNVLQTPSVIADTLTQAIQNTINCQIGARNGANDCFNGQIDEVVIYNYELSSGQVANRYNGGTGREDFPFDIHSNAEIGWRRTIDSNAHIKTIVGAGEVSPTANTKGIWHMNNGPWSGVSNEIVDNSGNAHHGTAYGSATTVAAGKIGRCGHFPGGSDYALVTGSTDFNFGATGDFSISFWVKTLNAVTSTQCIFSKLSSGVQYGYYIQVKPAVITFGIDEGGATSEVDSLTEIDDTTWHHIVAIRDSSGIGLKIYIDGQLDNSETVTARNVNGVYTLNFGRRADASQYYSGYIDELAIWNKALTVSEIGLLYNGGLAGMGVLHSDAELTRIGSKRTINSNASILKPTSKTINSSAYILLGETETILSDAYIKKIDNTKTLTSDAWIAIEYTKTINSNAYILKETPKTLLSDTFIKRLAYEKTINSDAYILKDANTKTILSDAWILKETPKTILSDAYIKHLAYEGTIVSDAYILKADNDKTINSDAVISTTGIIKTLLSDAYIWKQYRQTIQSIANILKPTPKTILSDAKVKRLAYEKSIPSNAVIRLVKTKTINSVAYIIFVYEKTLNSNAYIKKLDNTKTINSNSYILKTYSQTILSNSHISRLGVTETILSDAHIYKEISASIISDSYITYCGYWSDTWSVTYKVTFTNTINSNAYIQAEYSPSILSDAYITVLGNDKTINSNSYILQTYTKTLNSDMNIRGYSTTQPQLCDAIYWNKPELFSAKINN